MPDRAPDRPILIVREDELPVLFDYLDKVCAEAKGRRIAPARVHGISREPFLVSALQDPHRAPFSAEPSGPEWPGGIKLEDAVDFTFGFVHLLGFDLWIFTVPYRRYRMYTVPGQELPPKLQDWFAGVIQQERLTENWDEMARVAASTFMARLNPSMAFMRLHEAKRDVFEGFLELGRSLKTLFLMDMVGDVELCKRLMLKEGEATAQGKPSPSARKEGVDERAWNEEDDPRWPEVLALYRRFKRNWGPLLDEAKERATGEAEGDGPTMREWIAGLPADVRTEVVEDLEELQFKLAPILLQAVLHDRIKKEDVERSPFGQMVLSGWDWVQHLGFGRPEPGSSPFQMPPPLPRDERGNKVFLPLKEMESMGRSVSAASLGSQFMQRVFGEAVEKYSPLGEGGLAMVEATWQARLAQFREYGEQIEQWKQEADTRTKRKRLAKMARVVAEGEAAAMGIIGWVAEAHARTAKTRNDRGAS